MAIGYIGMKVLECIELPQSLTRVKDGAFREMSINTLIISKEVKGIMYLGDALNKCKFKNVYIEESVKVLDLSHANFISYIDRLYIKGTKTKNVVNDKETGWSWVL